mgnify:CR=1 FL=1
MEPAAIESRGVPRDCSLRPRRCLVSGVQHRRQRRRARVLTLSAENPASAALLGNLDLHVSIGKQDYKGLKLSFRRRSAGGVSLNGNFTISRCYGDNTNGGFPQLAQGFQDPANPARDRGRCDQDRTHLASFTVGYMTPRFDNAGLRIAASNWRVSGVVNARSGSWLTVTTGSDRLLNGQRFQEQRVNMVNENPRRCEDAEQLPQPRRVPAARARRVWRRGEKQHSRPWILEQRHGALEAHIVRQAERRAPTSRRST